MCPNIISVDEQFKNSADSPSTLKEWYDISREVKLKLRRRMLLDILDVHVEADRPFYDQCKMILNSTPREKLM